MALSCCSIGRLPMTTLFPCTTLFRSRVSAREPRRLCCAGRLERRHPVDARAWRRQGGDVSIRRRGYRGAGKRRSEEHTSELQSRGHLVCRLLLEKKKINI